MRLFIEGEGGWRKGLLGFSKINTPHREDSPTIKNPRSTHRAKRAKVIKEKKNFINLYGMSGKQEEGYF